MKIVKNIVKVIIFCLSLIAMSCFVVGIAFEIEDISTRIMVGLSGIYISSIVLVNLSCNLIEEEK